MTSVREKLENLKISTNELNKNVNCLKMQENNFSKRLDNLETLCKSVENKSKFNNFLTSTTFTTLIIN